MLRRTASLLLLASLLSWVSVLVNVQSARAAETIYIRSNGSVDPPGTPIQQNGNTYTFTSDIFDPIVVEKNDIILDGVMHILQGSTSTPGIDLSGRTNVTVRNIEITNFDYGIYLESSDHITISGTTLTNNSNGLWLSSSSYDTILGNTINTNVFEGIYVYFSTNNQIKSNSIKNNTFDGIYLLSSENNIISGNTIENNDRGISPYYSTNNKIYHNNFINNQFSVNPNEPADVWDNGYEGNYWSEYTGVDFNLDGIGDTSYVVDTNNLDHFPLMNRYWNPADINHDLKVDLKDIYATGKAFGSTPGSPRWNPHCDINEDGKVELKDYYAVAKNYGKHYY